MKEIVGRLLEKREIELAKRILESEGYEVRKLKESSDSDYKLYLASEHTLGKGGYYSYITVEHPSLGRFIASYRVTGYDSNSRIQTDGEPWEFLQKKSMKLTSEQIQFLKDNEEEIEQKIRRGIY